MIKGSMKSNKMNRSKYSNSIQKPSISKKPLPNFCFNFKKKNSKDMQNHHTAMTVEFTHHQQESRHISRNHLSTKDHNAFRRRIYTKPFQPIYEIQWHNNQWLQFDDVTNKQIETLRKKGFTKIAIRQDANLEKYIKYNFKPFNLDVLLELSLTNDSRRNSVESTGSTILHQPTPFAIRRTHWWHTSHHVGEAVLPYWLEESNVCSHPVVMDTSTTTVTGDRSQMSCLSSIPSHVSQPTAVVQMNKMSPSWLKPLNYTNPPYLLDRPALTTV
ncbi:hypothetical protein BDB01DRAFT_908463 [Pilobolus umbonatus]|nr:hypothetical protein BDB01DRAFT_908463 [Pilobolus umbonatus]